MSTVKYCALTTISISMKQFVMPAMTQLAQRNYSITVGCANDTKFAKSLPENIRYLPLDIVRGFNLWKTIKTIFDLYSFFRRDETDMVEYGTENVSFCAAIAGWMAGVPVRIYNHWGARYMGYTGFARSISLMIERTAAFFSTDIRQQSIKNMQMCIADRVYSARKVLVLGYGGTVGADFTKFDIARKAEYREQTRNRFGISDNDFVFGYVGSIRKDKGTNELLKAFRQIESDNAWLMLVGDIFEPDAPDAELMDWAKNSHCVVFTGRVEDVEHYIAAFDCIVHPSYREGLGMVLQEAGAMGVPYITTNIPGPSEFGINGKTGYLVEKGNADELRDRMGMYLNDREMVAEMSAQVFTLTEERYERKNMIKRICADRENLRKRIRRNA